MRQVNFGELAWQIVMAIRIDCPRSRYRNAVSRNPDIRARARRWIADYAARRVAVFDFLPDDPAARLELLAAAAGSETADRQLHSMAHDHTDPARAAQLALAADLARSLDRFEILTDRPEGPPFAMFGEDPVRSEEEATRALAGHGPLFG